MIFFSFARALSSTISNVAACRHSLLFCPHFLLYPSWNVLDPELLLSIKYKMKHLACQSLLPVYGYLNLSTLTQTSQERVKHRISPGLFGDWMAGQSFTIQDRFWKSPGRTPLIPFFSCTQKYSSIRTSCHSQYILALRLFGTSSVVTGIVLFNGVSSIHAWSLRFGKGSSMFT